MELSDQIVPQTPIEPRPKNFYDGGNDAVGPDRTQDPRIQLERVLVDGKEQFTMVRRIAYADRDLGELLVPKDLGSFYTDLTSVPALFTWLVPKTGEHLPAALLHDGLIATWQDERDGVQTYISTQGNVVNRAQADRIFRDAMADRGTSLVRRWLIWSAVTLGTIFSRNDVGMKPALRRYYRIVMAATLVIIVYVGLCATFDLADSSVPGFVQLPWMGDRPWWSELLGGAAGAVTVPFLLGVTWGRFRVAGWVGGITLSMLIHVTFFLLLVTAGYQIVDRVTTKVPMVAFGLCALLLTGAAGVTLWMTFT